VQSKTVKRRLQQNCCTFREGFNSEKSFSFRDTRWFVTEVPVFAFLLIPPEFEGIRISDRENPVVVLPVPKYSIVTYCSRRNPSMFQSSSGRFTEKSEARLIPGTARDWLFTVMGSRKISTESFDSTTTAYPFFCCATIDIQDLLYEINE